MEKDSLITITIPTTGRPDKLSQCLKSIDYKDTFIRIGAVSIEDVNLSDVSEMDNVSIIFNSSSIVEMQNDLAFASPDASHILAASDDIEFLPGAIRTAKECLLKVFPDGDGCVGLNIVNMEEKDRSPYAFMLVGAKFFNERLHRELFYPRYKHFYADTELGLYACSLGRFVFCYDARVIHHHPATGAPADKTHLYNRTGKWEHDNKLFNERRCNGTNTRNRLFVDMPDTVADR